MIVFAAFTPHTPLLLPTVGKENLGKMKETALGMEKLSEELYASHPDTIVIISSHSARHEDAFSINLHDEYIADAKDFGDLQTAAEFIPDLPLIDRIQRALRKNGIAFTLDSDAVLDHGCAIPLLLLARNLPHVKIIPISYSGLSPKDHAEFGRALKDVLTDSTKRIAVLASGDLSHCLSTDAPEGFHKAGPIFDRAIQAAVQDLSLSKLLSIKPETVEDASQCGYRPLLILMGTLERMQVWPEILAYEAPFGVGYLTAQFHLK